MSYLVTLDVFSGRENPTWVIPDSEAGGRADATASSRKGHRGGETL